MITKIIEDKLFYLINNESDIIKYLLDKNSKDYNINSNYILTNDLYWNRIDKKYYKPIDKFSGIFDGNGFKIHNLKIISNDQDSNVGFFKILDKSTVKNLKIHIHSKIKGKNFIGILAGLISESKIENIEISGYANIDTNNGSNLGFLTGEMNFSTVNQVYICLKNSTIRGLNNIGGFIGTLIKTQIKNSKLCGYISIIGLSCYNIDGDSFYDKFIETIDELFEVYILELYTDLKIINHINILKENGYDYEKLLNEPIQNLLDLGIEPKYALKYSEMVCKEKTKRHSTKNLKKEFSSSFTSGFIGYSMNNSILNCDVNFIGSIIGHYYVSGFVSIDTSSEFKNCCMEINGGLSSFKYINLFCSETTDLKNLSLFNNIKINRKTKINDVLVDINNIKLFQKIANTKYLLTFKDNVYPKSFEKVLMLDNELIKKDSILYLIFDYLLTQKQLDSLKVKNIFLKTENSVLLSLKKIFEKKWNYLSEFELNNFKCLGFNELSFNCLEFPNFKFNELTQKQRFSALKLGFNQIIWDNKYVQKVMSFNNNYDFSRFYGLEMNLRHILTFSIDIKNLTIKIPNYVKNIILKEMKKYLIEYFGIHMENNKNLNNNNLKIYFSDETNLDFVIIINHIEDKNEIDDSDKIIYEEYHHEEIKVEEEEIEYYESEDEFDECQIPDKIFKEVYIILKLELDNDFETKHYFTNNQNLFQQINQKILSLSLKTDNFEKLDIICYDIQNWILGFKLLIDFDYIKEVKNNGLFNLSNNKLIKILIDELPSDFVEYPENINYQIDFFDSSSLLKQFYYNSVKTLDYVIKTKKCFGDKVINNNSKAIIIGKLKINDVPAKSNDLILVYVDCELRGCTNLKIIDNESWFNLEITTNPFVEAIDIKVYQNYTELLYEAPEYCLNIKPGKIYGNENKPININVFGRPRPKTYNRIIYNPKMNYETPIKITALIKINFEYAKLCDKLIVYSNNRIIGKINVINKGCVYLADGIAYSSGQKEIITFEVYSGNHGLYFQVPNLKIVVEPGDILGTIDNPLLINAVGNVYIDFQKYNNKLINCEEIDEENKCYPGRKTFLSFYQALLLKNKIRKENENKYNGNSYKNCSINGCNTGSSF